MKTILACLAIAPLMVAGDDRAADREAVRAHIDRIFQAFIHKDAAELRATHAEHWLGYLEGSRTAIHGVDGYMNATGTPDPKNPYGMKSYTMREFDVIFHGDAAFACFVADVVANTPAGLSTRTLRITDFYTKQNGQWIQTGSDTQLHPESINAQFQSLRTLPEQSKKELLEAREGVWRAYFSNDRAALEKLIPAELVTVGDHPNGFGTRASVFEGASRFAQGGGKLLRIEFPKTEMQVYGFTAVLYSTYVYELEQGGKRSETSGRATEVFVYQNGHWVNPGWQLDSSK